MVETGTLLQNRFLIEECIGKGGMGAVYIATDQKFGSRVAIKETFYEDSELAEAFAREARILNSLHHPILPHVSDYFREGDGYFLVMEYIEGEDLSEILKREGQFPVNDVIRWTLELLDGLDYLHSQDPPIIHRDIKPHNLKLTSRGNIVLLDFGLAKETNGGAMGVKSVFGYSRRYSSLEQIEGVGTDPRSDIFSLGATVFHLLTGKQPIDVLARASAIVAGKPDPLQLVSDLNPEVPDSVSNVIRTAMALNADLRFVSANAMRNALEDAVHVSEEPAASIPVEDAVVIPVENFPALAAFKDEVEQVSTGSTEDEVIAETPNQDPESHREPVRVSEPVQVMEIPIHRPSARDRLATYAPWILLAVIAIFALSYAVFKGGSAEPQVEGVSSAPETATETASATADNAETASDSVKDSEPTSRSDSTPDDSEIAADNEADNESATRRPRSIKEPVVTLDRRKDQKPEPRAEPEPKRSERKSFEPPPVIIRTRPEVRYSPRPPRRERFARVPDYDQPPISTIETIFTGIPYERPYRRHRRN